MPERWTPLGCDCQARHFSLCFEYDQPVAGEIVFAHGRQGNYRREVHRCGLCGHFIELHDFDDSDLYAHDYVDATYGDSEGMRRAFERVMALDESRSDNAGRVRNVLDVFDRHAGGRMAPGRAPSVLDVGSGLCVFLHRMKAAGWDCTALDVDPRQAEHAERVAGVRALCADFLTTDQLGRYDLITFNKVLEHVNDPVSMLAHAAGRLRAGGLVYVEVPDGEAAMAEGREREEFLLGHRHVFSAASLCLLVERAQFRLTELQRLREPSSKFTLRAFLVPAAPAA
ncbi:unnamed protein product [uncultured bacterium]|nr:unnamed protein product [uncultured bacterium]